MTRKKFYDPYAELIDKFNRGGVRYIVVGMSGINYYASKATDIFATQDFDIFIKPTLSNVKKALSVFKKLDYSVTCKDQEVSDCSIKDIVTHRKTILATDPYGIIFELILAVSGYTFNQMEQDARVFDVNKIPVKVGKLTKLIMSKKMAGRQKDKLFLKRLELLLKEKKNEQ